MTIACRWQCGHLCDLERNRRLAATGRGAKPLDRPDRVELRGCEAFRLSLAGGKQLAASELKLLGRPAVENVAPAPQAWILAQAYAGIRQELHGAAGLRRRQLGSRVARSVTRRGQRHPAADHADGQEPADPRRGAATDRVAAPGVVVGSVPGSPLVVGELFSPTSIPTAQPSLAIVPARRLKRSFSFPQANR